MPWKVPLGKRLALKNSEHAELLEKLAILQAANRKARFEHSLLLAWCDFLQWLRQQEAPDPWLAASLDELLLLDELQQHPVDSSTSSHANQPSMCSLLRSTGSTSNTSLTSNTSFQNNSGDIALDVALDKPMAPADDPLCLFREVYSREIFPGIESMDLRQILAEYSEGVRNIALQLRVCDNPFLPDCNVQPVAELKQTVIGTFSLVWSLQHCHRHDKVFDLAWSNCATGQRADLNQNLYLWAIKRMGLTAEQRERIAGGYAVFDRLLTPMLQQRIQLQQELAAPGVDSAAELFASAVLPAGMRQPRAADVLDQQQQEKLRQLQLVMKKAIFLEFTISLFTCGVVTLRQACHLMVDLFPLPCAVTRVSKFVADEFQQQQQQHLVQQQQQPQGQQAKQQQGQQAKQQQGQQV